MLFFKILIGVAFVAVLVGLIVTLYYGEDLCVSFRKLRHHKKAANWTLGALVVAIALTEIFVRINGGVQHPKVLMFHLCAAIPFVILVFLLRFWVTGIRYPGTHGFLAFMCIILFVLTLFSGFYLLAHA